MLYKTVQSRRLERHKTSCLLKVGPPHLHGWQRVQFCRVQEEPKQMANERKCSVMPKCHFKGCGKERLERWPRSFMFALCPFQGKNFDHACQSKLLTTDMGPIGPSYSIIPYCASSLYKYSFALCEGTPRFVYCCQSEMEAGKTSQMHRHTQIFRFADCSVKNFQRDLYGDSSETGVW